MILKNLEIFELECLIQQSNLTFNNLLINVMIPNLYAHSGESNLANPLLVWTLDPSVVVNAKFCFYFIFAKFNVFHTIVDRDSIID